MERVKQWVVKYRYALLVVLLGVVLMLLPAGGKDAGEEESSPTRTQQIIDLSDQLEGILSQIQGVGKVQVMLTLKSGETIHYQTDVNGEKTETVILSGTDRVETGLILRSDPPEYRGAIVVCQGADSPAVRLSIIEAVSKVTGLGTDRISVLKMK